MEKNEKLMELINKLSKLTPFNPESDYCRGFHFAIGLVKRYAQGEDPFVFEFGGCKIALEEENAVN